MHPIQLSKAHMMCWNKTRKLRGIAARHLRAKQSTPSKLLQGQVSHTVAGSRKRHYAPENPHTKLAGPHQLAVMRVSVLQACSSPRILTFGVHRETGFAGGRASNAFKADSHATDAPVPADKISLDRNAGNTNSAGPLAVDSLTAKPSSTVPTWNSASASSLKDTPPSRTLPLFNHVGEGRFHLFCTASHSNVQILTNTRAHCQTQHFSTTSAWCVG